MRQQGRSSLVSPLSSFTPSSSPPIFTLPDLPIPTPSPTVHPVTERLLDTLPPQTTLSYELVISRPHHTSLFALSVSCSVTRLLDLSPPCPPPCIQSGVWFTSTEIWCLTLKAEQRQGHMEKFFQAVSHWLIAHPRPHLQPWWFFCQMLSCCFPPLPHLFYSLESVVETGLQFTDMKWNL